jgi:ATPase subunit of ABC transporter with duplicated ATPase domains
MLSATDLAVHAVDGRPLVQDLTLQLGREQVAVVGRNGVGKSSLLRVLAEEEQPTSGEIRRNGTIRVVHQRLTGDASPGELRQAALARAFQAEPDLLFLDEPSNDLDERGRSWLLRRLRRWRNGLLVVSHDPDVLAVFNDFFVIAEAGCSHRSGTWSEVVEELEVEASNRQEQFVRSIVTFERQQHDYERVRRRRQRKKAVGRLHELDRCQSKSRLNKRKSAAQVSQAKVDQQHLRALAVHERWSASLKRALSVALPLSAAIPDVEPGPRRGILGPNGSGKSTWLRTQFQAGDGIIEQGAQDWMRDESLRDLLERYLSWDHVAQHLVAHRFPLGLAERPLRTLSPGERTRAALLAVFQAVPERLVLDEPTWSLDSVGRAALTDVLTAWKGPLLVVSHDRTFLEALGTDVEDFG